MRRRYWLLTSGAVLALSLAAPRPTEANGLTDPDVWRFVAILLLTVVTVVALVVEALVYRFALPTDWRRAFPTSLYANFLGYLVMLPAALSDLGWPLLPLALAAIAVEVSMVWLANRDFPHKPRLLAIAIGVNLLHWGTCMFS